MRDFSKINAPVMQYDYGLGKTVIKYKGKKFDPEGVMAYLQERFDEAGYEDYGIDWNDVVKDEYGNPDYASEDNVKYVRAFDKFVDRSIENELNFLIENGKYYK